LLERGEAWDLTDVVGSLREARGARDGLLVGTPRRPARPARAAIAAVVTGLRAALFPRHFGPVDLTDEGVDFFVGHTLDVSLRPLVEQVRRGLRHAAGGGDDPRHAADAAALVGDFARRLPEIRSPLERDLRAAFDGDPAAYDLDEVLLCYPGITAITHHRLAHALFGLGATLVARSIAEIAHADTGVDIHPGAAVAGSFFIDHGTGVVIGETTVIGERVRLYQGVTLGARSFPTDAAGQIIKGAPRHPIVEDDVVIYAGASVLGRVTIGRGSSIGGNVWLTRSVAPGSRITQAQARDETFSAAGTSVPLAIAAGLLVGVGARLANGCTSGHGVCGVSRLAPRALAATATFIATGALTVFLTGAAR